MSTISMEIGWTIALKTSSYYLVPITSELNCLRLAIQKNHLLFLSRRQSPFVQGYCQGLPATRNRGAFLAATVKPARFEFPHHSPDLRLHLRGLFRHHSAPEASPVLS